MNGKNYNKKNLNKILEQESQDSLRLLRKQIRLKNYNYKHKAMYQDIIDNGGN